MDRKKIAIVVMSADLLMDFAGPAEVFGLANKHCDLYDIVLVSPGTRHLCGAAGIEIRFTGITELEGAIDTLLIAGYDCASNYDNFYNWLAMSHSNIRRIGAIGVDAHTVAKLELLNDNRNAADDRYNNPPGNGHRELRMECAPFHSRDGQLYTSGGVSSGIDLALDMVTDDCGRGIATDVAKKLIFFYLSRQVYRVQFGSLITASPMAANLKEWLAGRLHEQLDVTRLAETLHMSPRNFTRVFTRQTGMSPAKFIEKIRVEAARKFLDETDSPLEEIARVCGLGGLVSMRRLFLRHLMITPSEYRRILKLHKNENSN